jgi:AcrR family transcriptional regulator
MARSVHPTKEKLIDTMISLMDEHALASILVDDVLRESNISKGSMYHHFENFEDLVEAALIARFAAGVDYSIDLVSEVVRSSSSAQEFAQKFAEVTSATQGRTRSRFRMERARVIGLSVNSPKLSEALEQEQLRLTSALADLVRECQEKGWVSKKYEAKTIAVFLQAYTLGRVVDDVVGKENQVDPNDWNIVVNVALKALLTAN